MCWGCEPPIMGIWHVKHAIDGTHFVKSITPTFILKLLLSVYSCVEDVNLLQ